MEKVCIFPNPLKGEVHVPSSKSMGHREIMCAGLANGRSLIDNISMSKDIEATFDSLTTHFRRFITLAHQKGLSVYACTITPFEGHYYYTKEHEQLRQRFNDWLRTKALIEKVIDLDVVLADPNHPSSIPAALQDNDGLHPSALGHQRIGEAISNVFIEP